MEENLEFIQELVVLYGVKILMALVIFIIGKWDRQKDLQWDRKVNAEK